MVKIFIDADGNEVDESSPNRLGSRKQELERLRLLQVKAQKLNLQDVAEHLLNDGPGMVGDIH